MQDSKKSYKCHYSLSHHLYVNALMSNKFSHFYTLLANSDILKNLTLIVTFLASTRIAVRNTINTTWATAVETARIWRTLLLCPVHCNINNNSVTNKHISSQQITETCLQIHATNRHPCLSEVAENMAPYWLQELKTTQEYLLMLTQHEVVQSLKFRKHNQIIDKVNMHINWLHCYDISLMS